MSYLLTRQEKQKEVTVQASIGVVGDHRTKEAAVVVVLFFRFVYWRGEGFRRVVMIVDVDAGVFSGGTGATQCVLSKMYRYRSTFPGQLIGSAVFCRTANSAPAQCKKKYTRKKSRCNGVNVKRTKGQGKGIGMGEVSLAVPSVVGGSREELGKGAKPGRIGEGRKRKRRN